MGVAGAILGGGAISAAGSLIGNVINRADNRENRAWQEQMVEKQNQWDLDMWNRQNEYNSPEQQMQRMRDAGLNPIDVANMGDAGNSTNLPSSSSVPGVSPTHIDNPLTAFGDALGQSQMAKYQVEKMQAETSKINAETLSLNMKRDKEIELLGVTIGMNDSVRELNNTARDKYASEIALNAKKVEDLQSQIYSRAGHLDLDKERLLFDKQTTAARLAIERGKLNLDEKHLLVDYLNAQSQEIVANATASAEYRELQKHELVLYKLDAEGRLIDEKVTWQEFQNRIAETEYQAAEKRLKYVGAQELARTISAYTSVVKDVAVSAASIVGTIYAPGAAGAISNFMNARKSPHRFDSFQNVRDFSRSSRPNINIPTSDWFGQ